MLAPERDPSFHPDLKKVASEVIPTLGVAYDYQYFPGVEHSFATRGDERDEIESIIEIETYHDYNII
jgi:hypothetical protein